MAGNLGRSSSFLLRIFFVESGFCGSGGGGGEGKFAFV